LSKKTLTACKLAKLTPVFQVKKNQKTLLQNFKHHIKFSTPIKEISNKHKPTKAHGRIEIREIRTYKPNNKKPGQLGFITDINWRKELKVIIEITRITKTKDTKKLTKDSPIYKVSKEKAYYFTTTATLSAKELQDIIRNHWRTETSNHYVRDVTLQEDKSRIRKNPIIMAIIRSTALNTIRYKLHNHDQRQNQKLKTYQNIQQEINTNKWSDAFFEDYSWLWRTG
jgi:predicted transposase YbfD/YdcC